MKHTVTLNELIFFEQKTTMASSSTEGKKLLIVAKTSMNTDHAIAHYEVLNNEGTIFVYTYLPEAIKKYNSL